MATHQIRITVRLSADEASAMLAFLRHVSPREINWGLDGDGDRVKAVNEASERLRVKLREALEG